jgi:predicted alpha/beta superfamily hydrolase
LGNARKSNCRREADFIFKNFKENREIWVHLPKTYNDSSINPAKYPVIYLLDGEINFEYYAGMTDFLSKSSLCRYSGMYCSGH